jgi:hypothetical protein
MLNPAPKNAVAILFALQTLLFLVPIIVLGSAIGWPASLRLPAEAALPLIDANRFAVRVGYSAYLAVSVALIPLAFAFRAWLAARGLAGWMFDTLAFAGAAAGVLKTLGIVRWLAAMPLLAEQYAAADEGTRQNIAAVYTGLNAYAGSVGELLGVQLMGGLWITGVGAALVVAKLRWIGFSGLAIGVMFVVVGLRIFVPELAALQSVVIPAALVWLMVVAYAIWRA